MEGRRAGEIKEKRRRQEGLKERKGGKEGKGKTKGVIGEGVRKEGNGKGMEAS